MYRQLIERGELPWQESARPYVLDAIDRAKSWSELHERLVAHGVVAKLVKRCERIRGLAFAEGFERGAPGCAASRIDTRCALPALERRFGRFTPSRELTKDTSDGAQWVQNARATILGAVDSARSWEDLTQQLDRDGIVVKLIARGTRVQGLAFAQGRDPGRTGLRCVADPSALQESSTEQRFGACPFPRKQPPKRSRSSVCDRAEREANTDPRWALRDAQRIVDHARIRSKYAQYRDRFFADHHRATADRRAAASERERVQRHLRGQAPPRSAPALARSRRGWPRAARSPGNSRTGRSMPSSIAGARTSTTPGACVGSGKDRAGVRTRLGARGEADGLSFVGGAAARVGDLAAQRVLGQSRLQRIIGTSGRRSAMAAITVDQMRERLHFIRAEVEDRYEHARIERRGLTRLELAATIEEALASARRDPGARQ